MSVAISWLQSAPPWGCVRILSSQSSLTILSGCRKYITSVEEWSCKEVSKWSATVKGMPDDFGPSIVSNGVNRTVLLAMQQGYLNEIVVTQVGSLEILLE